MRANDNKTAAKLLCRVQVWSIEDVSAVAANLEAIFGTVGGRIVRYCFCRKKLSQPNRKKEARTTEDINMILIRVLNNNINFDILSRNSFQSNHFLLF